MARWAEHYVCDCGWYTEPAFGDPWCIYQTVCPDCGDPIQRGISGIFKMKTRRWVSTARLLLAEDDASVIALAARNAADRELVRELNRLDMKFRSGNSVPVERATITVDEWNRIRELVG